MSIASAPNCQVGSWIQKWNCGWNAHKTGAHVSYNPLAGHTTSGQGSALIVALVIGLIVLFMISRKGGRSAAASR